MTVLLTSDRVPAFDAPEETAQKLGRAFTSRIDWDAVRRRGAAQRGQARPDPLASAPLLDQQAIAAEYGPQTAYAPQWKRATFRVPLGIRWSQYERWRDERAAAWIAAEAKDGWDLCADSRIEVRPGPYPAVDLATGLKLLGEREVILLARFVNRRPTLYTWELPRAWFEHPDRERPTRGRPGR